MVPAESTFMFLQKNVLSLPNMVGKISVSYTVILAILRSFVMAVSLTLLIWMMINSVQTCYEEDEHTLSDASTNKKEITGLLFESLCVRDLRAYVESLGGSVFHYRDKTGLKVYLVQDLP